jgi:hypothetical protein
MLTEFGAKKDLNEYDFTSYNDTRNYDQKRTVSAEKMLNLLIDQWLQAYKETEQLWPILAFIAEEMPEYKLPSHFNKDELLLKAAKRKICNEQEHKINRVNIQYLLACGANPNSKEKDNADNYYTSLMRLVAQENADPATIKLLLENNKTNIKIFDQNGKTALFHVNLANPKATEIFQLLISLGLKIDEHPFTTRPEEKITLLEKSIDENNPYAFITLVSLGAGQSINADKTLSFIRSHQYNPQLNDAMVYCLNKLIQINKSISSKIYLETMLASAGTPGAKQFEMIDRVYDPSTKSYKHECKELWFRPEIAKQIFNSNDDVQKHNKSGNHPVAHVKLLYPCGNQTIQLEAHFKLAEMFPHTEFAGRFAELIFPSGQNYPPSRFIRCKNKQGLSFPIQYSQHVDGPSLADIFSKEETYQEFNKKLDPKNFTQALFLTLLLGDKDKKAENVFASGDLSKILDVDPEQIFMWDEIQSIILLMPQMKNALDKETCEQFCKLKPEEVFKQLDEDSDRSQELREVLFNEADRIRLRSYKHPDAGPMPLYVRPFTTLKIRDQFYKRFLNLQNIARALMEENSAADGLRLVFESDPLLHAKYAPTFKYFKNPLEAFCYLFEKQYAPQPGAPKKRAYFSTVSTGASLLLSQKNTGAMTDAEVEQTVTGPLAFTHRQRNQSILQRNVTQTKSIDENVKYLIQGETEFFKQLNTMGMQEEVLQKINFEQIPLTNQTKIFKALWEVELSDIRLIGSSVNTDTLKEILKKNKNVITLNLKGCKKLDASILMFIAEKCPNLERLTLDEIPFDALGTESKPLIFPRLRRLCVNNTPAKELHMTAPALESLEIKGTALNKLKIQGDKLKFLLCKNKSGEILSAQLIEELNNLIMHSPELVKSGNKQANIQGDYLPSAKMFNWFLQYDSAFLNLQLLKSWINKSELVSHYPFQEWVKNGEFTLYYPIDKNLLLEIAQSSEIKTIILKCPLPYDLHNLITFSKARIDVRDFSIKPEQKPAQENPGANGVMTLGFDGTIFRTNAQDKDKKYGITIYNPRSVQPQKILKEHAHAISQILALNANMFASVDNNGQIKICDITRNKALFSFKEATINSLLYSPENETLIVASNTSFKIMDIYTGLETQKFTTKEIISSLANDSKNFILAGSDRGNLTVWSQNAELPLKTLTIFDKKITCLSALADGIVAAGSINGDIKIVDYLQGKTLTTINGSKTNKIQTMVYLGNHFLAIGISNEKNIKIAHIKTGAIVQELPGHKTGIVQLSVSDELMLSTSTDGEMIAWQFPLVTANKPIWTKTQAKPTVPSPFFGGHRQQTLSGLNKTSWLTAEDLAQEHSSSKLNDSTEDSNSNSTSSDDEAAEKANPSPTFSSSPSTPHIHASAYIPGYSSDYNYSASAAATPASLTDPNLPLYVEEVDNPFVNFTNS